MEGLSQLSTMRRLPYGGQDLTRLLGTLMAQRGAALPPGKEGEAVAEALKLRLLRPAEPAPGAAGGGGVPPGGGDEAAEVGAGRVAGGSWGWGVGGTRHVAGQRKRGGWVDGV